MTTPILAGSTVSTAAARNDLDETSLMVCGKLRRELEGGRTRLQEAGRGPLAALALAALGGLIGA